VFARCGPVVVKFCRIVASGRFTRPFTDSFTDSLRFRLRIPLPLQQF